MLEQVNTPAEYQGQKLWENLIPYLTSEPEGNPASEKFWLDYEQLITQNKSKQAQRQLTASSLAQKTPLQAKLFEEYWPPEDRVLKGLSIVNFSWGYFIISVIVITGWISVFSDESSYLFVINTTILIVTLLSSFLIYWFDDQNQFVQYFKITFEPDHFIYQVQHKKRIQEIQVLYQDIDKIEKFGSNILVATHQIQVLKNQFQKPPIKDQVLIPKSIQVDYRVKAFLKDMAKINQLSQQ